MTSFFLNLGPPQFILLILSGALLICTASALTGSKSHSILALFLIGLLLSAIGTDVNTGIERFTFGIDYLSDLPAHEVTRPLLIGSLLIFMLQVIILKSDAFSFTNTKFQTPLKVTLFLLSFLGFLNFISDLAFIFGLSNDLLEPIRIYILCLFIGLGMMLRFYHLPILPLLYGITIGKLLEENIVRSLLINRGDYYNFTLKLFSYWGADLIFALSLLIFISAVIWRSKHERLFLKV